MLAIFLETHHCHLKNGSKHAIILYTLWFVVTNLIKKLDSDYHLKAIPEMGPRGWFAATRHLPEAPVNWEEDHVTNLLDMAQESFNLSVQQLNIRGRVIRKKRSVGLCPQPNMFIPREALDETVLTLQNKLMNRTAPGVHLPRCIFNGGTDAWCDCGNKRVGVMMLQSYLGIPSISTLHIGDQFLNTGNDYAARDVCPCVWITSPEETTYILKNILRLAGLKGVDLAESAAAATAAGAAGSAKREPSLDFQELDRRSKVMKVMDVCKLPMCDALVCV